MASQANPTAEWERVGSKFYRKIQLYTAVFDQDLELENYVLAGAPCGGAIGMCWVSFFLELGERCGGEGGGSKEGSGWGRWMGMVLRVCCCDCRLWLDRFLARLDASWVVGRIDVCLEDYIVLESLVT